MFCFPYICRKVETKKGYLFVGQLDTPFATMKYTNALKDLDGKIVECKYENNQWKCMRERTDKSYPNSLNTAKGGRLSVFFFLCVHVGV